MVAETTAPAGELWPTTLITLRSLKKTTTPHGRRRSSGITGVRYRKRSAAWREAAGSGERRQVEMSGDISDLFDELGLGDDEVLALRHLVFVDCRTESRATRVCRRTERDVPRCRPCLGSTVQGRGVIGTFHLASTKSQPLRLIPKLPTGISAAYDSDRVRFRSSLY